MPECNLPLIICRLTDKDGRILDPFAPNALSFTELCSSQKRTEPERCAQTISVLISGYIVVYVEGRDLSSPIPFRMIKKISIGEPDHAFLEFQVRKFEYTANPAVIGTNITEVEIVLNIEAVVRSCCWADLLVQPADLPERVLICEKKVCDYVCFDCGTTVAYEMHLKVLVFQYNALSDGHKVVYTKEDELQQYGNTGILPTNDHTLCSFFVNGVLQPKVNYSTMAGVLSLHTKDIPPQGAPLILSFLVLGQDRGKDLIASNNTYVTRSTGSKRIFRNEDKIPEYGDQVIPSPDEVSFYNLFVNGELQPTVNYVVKEGSLELVTKDLPRKGAMIILEYFVIQDDGGRLLRAQVDEYYARSHGNKIYTDQDELAIYGSQGIPDPNLYSFEHLFMNGIMQPKVNYSVEKGLLTIQTLDASVMEAPITLQFVCIFMP